MMMIETRPARSGPRYSLLALVTCALTTTSACAGSISAERDAEKPVLQAETSEPVRLNLLSGGQTTTVSRVSALQIGDGSYLCTPAGFGQRSWCRRN